MLGPHQSPIYIAWINPINSIILELWKLHSCLCKIKRNKRLFETRMELKTVREETGFLKFIWKLESWELNLRIEILEINRRWNLFEKLFKDRIFKILFLNNSSKFRFPNLISNFQNSNIHVHLFNNYFRYYYYSIYLCICLFKKKNSILKQFFKIPISEFNFQFQKFQYSRSFI